MAKVNISDAIKLSGVSRQTFYAKYINADDIKDRITIEIDSNGHKRIDTAELMRMFGQLHFDRVDKTPPPTVRHPPIILTLESRIRELESELKLQRELNDYAKEQISRSDVREAELHKHIDELIRRQPEPVKQIGWLGKILTSKLW